NGTTAFARDLVGAIRDGVAATYPDQLPGELLICPPHPLLQGVQALLANSPILLGGQNISEHKSGPHTGEVSADMLHDLGCRAVILGHSERRSLHQESDALIARKVAAALQAQLTPIVCLGESLQQRQNQQTLEIIEKQLSPLLPLLRAQPQPPSSWVLAYEPIWAIGSGLHAQPEQIQEVHAFIRQQIQQQVGATIASQCRILYGGSVSPGNAAEIFALPDVDGGLIGGASLKADSFLSIFAALSTPQTISNS
ncbi:MAG: triose-phosphate isomerase, partial [Magnetococcales bacterium]|nr:triose-phosphate isomerase [Magnetococcales bacterium]